MTADAPALRRLSIGASFFGLDGCAASLFSVLGAGMASYRTKRLSLSDVITYLSVMQVIFAVGRMISKRAMFQALNWRV